MSYFAQIALPIPIRKLFTYSIPDSLVGSCKPGVRVYVSFQNRFVIGLVQRITDTKPDFKTKAIKEVLDENSLFSPNLMQLADWVQRYYFCSFGEAVQAMLPAGFNFQSIKYVKSVGEHFLLTGNRDIDDFLHDVYSASILPLQETLLKHRLVSTADLTRLVELNRIEIWEEPRIKAEIAKEKVWDWTENGRVIGDEVLANTSKKLKWVTALELIKQMPLPAKTSELEDMGIIKSGLKKLESLGIIHLIEREKKYINTYYQHEPQELKALNQEQFVAYEHLKECVLQHKHTTFLLKGITGSGKTEVYIHTIKTCLEAGKGAIVLVPEIALTPQTVSRFYQIFGDKIAVLHSRLTDQERLFAWNELKNGSKTIAIGPRSAVFAPVQHLGVIIVDEEHDNSYRQEDPAPRYHGRDTAIMRGFIEKVPVVLGSATPSVTTWKSVLDGKFTLLELNNRHEGARLPDVELCDLTQYRKAMFGPLTAALYKAMQQALERNEQIILLLNRRGYSPYLHCLQCGTIQQCPNCSVSLTYHKPKRVFMCHYCGYSRYEKSACSQCGNPELEFQGLGTQKAEEEIEHYFPDAKIMRMDQDTTRGKHAHRDLIEAFRNKEFDILIGTQIVSKGLDFPDVTVVGVLNADTELAFPSYRAQERLFQLMSQVAGRSGRGQKPGKVWLQSWKPDSFSLHAAKKHDYMAFVTQELKNREELQYPPFSKLIQFTFKSKHAEETAEAARLFYACLQRLVPDWPVLGPAPSTIYKIEREYFWDLILKMRFDVKTGFIEQLLTRVFEEYDADREKKFSTVRVIVKVDY